MEDIRGEVITKNNLAAELMLGYANHQAITR